MGALFEAAKNGLKLPRVHNGEGEESMLDLKLLDGLVDMYIPDVKFIRPETSERIGLSRHYPRRMKEAIVEMYRQVGPLRRPSDSAEIVGVDGGLVRQRHRQQLPAAHHDAVSASARCGRYPRNRPAPHRRGASGRHQGGAKASHDPRLHELAPTGRQDSLPFASAAVMTGGWTRALSSVP